MVDFRAKHIFIAGGGRGISAAAAKQLGALGARVFVCDLGCDLDGSGQDPAVGEEVAAAIRQAGGEARAGCYDLSLQSRLEAAIQDAEQAFGPIDGGVYGPAIQAPGAIVRSDLSQVERLIDLQVNGMFAFVRTIAQAAMRHKSPCSLVTFSDPRVWFGVQGQGASSLAAGAVAAFVRSAALEFRRYGVRINAIAPLARTRINADLPMFKRVGQDSLTPEDAARAVCFLLSERSQGVSGETLHIAGNHLSTVRVLEVPGVTLEEKGSAIDQVAEGWSRLLERMGPG